jgi:uncharacterized protein (DUF952 family)
MQIYHILLPETWERVRGNSFYEAESLSTEGFIHCSYEDQLEGVLGRYYADAEEVVILTLDANRLTSPLVSEPSTNNEPYPHIYGPINFDAVVEAVTRPVGSVPA